MPTPVRQFRADLPPLCQEISPAHGKAPPIDSRRRKSSETRWAPSAEPFADVTRDSRCWSKSPPIRADATADAGDGDMPAADVCVVAGVDAGAARA